MLNKIITILLIIFLITFWAFFVLIFIDKNLSLMFLAICSLSGLIAIALLGEKR